jgi:SMODS-associating 2TM, beta-strand rich effector domain
MMNVREEALGWVRIAILVSIWAAVLYISKTGLAISWDAVKQLPAVVTVYTLLSYIFTKWLWRLPLLQGWLVPFPDLEGTWQGEVRSTWRDPKSDQQLPPLPVILTIKQSFLSISCAMHAIESDSYSTAAQISQDDDGTLRLSFNYTNRPKATVRDRIAIHDGAAILKIVGRRRRTLEGEY